MLAAGLFLLLAFAPGERLEYDVRFGPFRLGQMVLLVLPTDTIGADSCFRFRAELESNPTLGFVFRARYELETWCRMRDMVTLRSSKRSEESRYRAAWVADFDHENRVAVYSSGDTLPLPDSARDLLTLWYFFRAQPLILRDTLGAQAHVDRKNYEVEVVVSSQRRVRTGAGDFECLEIVPRVASPLGTVFLSDDPERLPVVIRTKIGGMLVSAFLRRVERAEGG